MGEFSDKSSSATKEVKKILNVGKLTHYLSYISTNYKIIVDTILKLEKQNIALSESVELINNLQKKIKKTTRSYWSEGFKKLDSVLEKMRDLKFCVMFPIL